MRNTIAIAGKETRIYLTTWTSYILAGAFLMVTAFFFYESVRQFLVMSQQYSMQQAEGMLEQMNLTDWVMAGVFHSVAFFFLFLLPILTMRLVAEERKTKTLELLLTAPVRPLEIVLGKYLGALLIMVLMLAVTVVFPLLLHIYGASGGDAAPVDWNTVGAGYFGLFLLGAAFVAVGLFASAVTESQIIAVVVGWAILLMFYVIGVTAQGQEGPTRELLEHLGLLNHLETFIQGIVSLKSVVYYLSLAFVGLFLTYRVIEAQRWR